MLFREKTSSSFTFGMYCIRWQLPKSYNSNPAPPFWMLALVEDFPAFRWLYFFLKLRLCSSIQSVVSEVASALSLPNVTAESVRVEDVKQKFDFVVSRAVTAFPRFVEMVRSKINNRSNNDLPNGILYLKGGDFEEEIMPFRQQIRIFELKNYFQEEFFETKRLIQMTLKNK
jgi:hypothetical protein